MTAKTGGQMGWRMPSTSELSSLLDTTQTDPALRAAPPFDLGGLAFSSARRRGKVRRTGAGSDGYRTLQRPDPRAAMYRNRKQ